MQSLLIYFMIIIGDNMNEKIFRAYDIRGIYGEELNSFLAYHVGYAFGQELETLNQKQIVVGYDNRDSSHELATSLMKGLTDSGMEVINVGLATTPMVYYASVHYKIDPNIIVTASHSPAQYNGIKIGYSSIKSMHGEEIQRLKNQIKENINKELSIKVGQVIDRDIKPAYLEMLKTKIKMGPRKLKVVIDCGNGTGSVIAEAVFKNTGMEIIPIFCESDGSFPNHHPDPAVLENNHFLIEKVLETKADVGFGFDGDGDRLGIIDEKGNMIYADIFMAIIWNDLMPKLSDKKALLDVKCSKALEDEIVRLGGKPVYNRTGHSFMKKAMTEGNFLFGGELSGHVFFRDDFYGYDDGIYAALRLLKILSESNRSLSSYTENIPKYHSTPEILVKVTDSTKFQIVEKITEYSKNKGYETLTIDGVRVLFPDGWVLVRASNTGPNLTTRYEATNETRLEEIKQEFQTELEKIIKTTL